MQNNIWYKNPWVWLIIALPMSAVIGGIATVIITSMNSPDMVVDDYYKKGKAINLELGLVKKAEQLGIELEFKVTDERLEIKSNQTFPALQLVMVHSTLARRDFTTVLTPNAIGTLSSIVEQELSGKWKIIISPMDNSWKIKKEITLPYSNWTKL